MKKNTLLSLLVFTLFATSCYRAPSDTIFVEDLDMVLTNYMHEINYPEEYVTYAVADSFGLSSNKDDVTIDDANDPALRAAIKEAIIRNMGDTSGQGGYGYRLILLDDIDSSNIPDIYIPVTLSYVNTTGVAYYPIYSPGWGWGYPGYGYGYGGWGGYYSWGYIPTTYSYDQGSIIINWVDVKNRKNPLPGDSIPRTEIVWDLSISGLLENSTGNDQYERARALIDKGFEQSPYLKK